MLKTHVKQSLFALLLICGGLFLSLTAQAQAGSSSTFAYSSSLSWKTEQEAMTILTNTVDALHQAMQSLAPGSPAYLDLYNHAAYYKAILIELQNGATTPDAVVGGLPKAQFDAGASSGIAANNQGNYQQLQVYFQDAVDLLTN